METLINWPMALVYSTAMVVSGGIIKVLMSSILSWKDQRLKIKSNELTDRENSICEKEKSLLRFMSDSMEKMEVLAKAVDERLKEIRKEDQPITSEGEL